METSPIDPEPTTFRLVFVIVLLLVITAEFVYLNFVGLTPRVIGVMKMPHIPSEPIPDLPIIDQDGTTTSPPGWYPVAESEGIVARGHGWPFTFWTPGGETISPGYKFLPNKNYVPFSPALLAANIAIALGILGGIVAASRYSEKISSRTATDQSDPRFDDVQ